jgi:transcriptional regulator with XRE-family HTH domain
MMETNTEMQGAGNLQLNGIQERVKDLLAAGVSQTQVASAVGVSESYISQLMENEEFRDEVIRARGEAALEDVKADEETDDIEGIARRKIKQLLPFENNVMKVLKVYQVMNGAKRKTEPAQQLQNTAGVIVNITLPQRAIVDFKLTSDRQVVEVAGRSMATLPSNVLHQKLRQEQANRLLLDKGQPIEDAVLKKLQKF